MRPLDLRVSEELENFDYARRPIKSSERAAGDVPYLGASGVVDSVAGFTHEGDFLCVSEDGENLRSRKTPIAWVQRGRFWANNHLHVLGGVSLSRLRFYAAALNEANVASYLTGSAQPKLSQQSLNDILLPRFTASEQVRIGEVLGALDDKFAANRRTIATIDELGRLVAEQETVGGSDRSLISVVKLLSRGVAPKYADEGYLVLNQKCLRNGRVDVGRGRTMSALPAATEKILRRGDVLVNSTGQGTLGRVARWTRYDDAVSVDSHVSIVRIDPSIADQDFVGTLLLNREADIEALAEGTTGQTELRRNALGALPIRLPSLDVQQRIGERLRAMAALMDAMDIENQRLAGTRSELLPLLMGGTITVKDVEMRVEQEA